MCKTAWVGLIMCQKNLRPAQRMQTIQMAKIASPPIKLHKRYISSILTINGYKIHLGHFASPVNNSLINITVIQRISLPR
ncbi:hypothetical protein CW304_17175 [Bacillus sp. UFRGS-B20]|nr:hypothetical protein CW304_17175 [Bacillus sp. UFRGS-B20]